MPSKHSLTDCECLLVYTLAWTYTCCQHRFDILWFINRRGVFIHLIFHVSEQIDRISVSYICNNLRQSHFDNDSSRYINGHTLATQMDVLHILTHFDLIIRSHDGNWTLYYQQRKYRSLNSQRLLCKQFRQMDINLIRSVRCSIKSNI